MVLQVSDRIETRVREYMAREGFEDADAAIESLLDRSGDLDREDDPLVPLAIEFSPEASEQLREILSEPPPHSEALERAKARHAAVITRSAP